MGRKLELQRGSGVTKNVKKQHISMSLTADVTSQSKVFASPLWHLNINKCQETEHESSNKFTKIWNLGQVEYIKKIMRLNSLIKPLLYMTHECLFTI